jgi:hypothetical protein
VAKPVLEFVAARENFAVQQCRERGFWIRTGQCSALFALDAQRPSLRETTRMGQAASIGFSSGAGDGEASPTATPRIRFSHEPFFKTKSADPIGSRRPLA